MAITGISSTGTNTTVAPPELAPPSGKPVAPADQSVVAGNGLNVAAAKPVPQPLPTESDVKSAVSTINKYLAPNANDIQFVQDKDSGITLVQIVDTATGEVVRQIPTQQVVEISKDLAKLQGSLVKEKA